jgi:glutamyl-tRNA synthetase
MTRVRFAPSPTGYLHVGGARTALFNWLYVRRHRGVFVLRIEDTDAERSSWDMVHGIVEGMRWLGLDWDEGPDVGGPHAPYFQSERLQKYRAAGERLVAEGHGYYCYCHPDELARKREAGQARGEGWTYDRTCLALPKEEIARREFAKLPRAIRFLVPPGQTEFTDLVRGRITIDHAHLEDFVVLRSDMHPTYHLSVVVDDIDMAITHVVRGEDHISNTPKQVLLYQAFGKPTPQFAHLPLILGPDKKRLSKRHGATSVMEYERLGYLSEAMVNFLALLGWSPGDDREVMTRDELIAAFTLEGIGGGNAVFNPEKLDWMNSQHILRMPPAEVLRRIQPDLRAAGLWHDDLAGSRREWFSRVIELLKARAKKLADFAVTARPFLTDAIEYDPGAAKKYLSGPDAKALLAALGDRLAAVDSFTAGPLETAVRELAEARGVRAAALIHPLRVATTGQTVSPGIFEVVELIGKERTLKRLRDTERLAAIS